MRSARYKSKKILPRKQVTLKLLQHISGHRSTILLMARYTANVLQDIECWIYPDPFCTSCQISSMNKKAKSKNPLNPKVPSKWVFMDIIPETATKSLISETTFSNDILMFDAQFKKKYGMDIAITEEAMDKLDTLQYRLGKIDKFDQQYLEKKSVDAGNAVYLHEVPGQL